MGSCQQKRGRKRNAQIDPLVGIDRGSRNRPSTGWLSDSMRKRYENTRTSSNEIPPYFDAAVMRLNDRLGHRQPKTPAALRSPRFVSPVESIEGVVGILGRNPYAGIAHLDIHVATAGIRRYLYTISRFRVLHGIIEHDSRKLPYLIEIGAQHNRIRTRERDLLTLQRSVFGIRRRHRPQNFHQIEGRPIQLRLIRVQSGKRQEIFRQPRQSIRLFHRSHDVLEMIDYPIIGLL